MVYHSIVKGGKFLHSFEIVLLRKGNKGAMCLLHCCFINYVSGHNWVCKCAHSIVQKCRSGRLVYFRYDALIQPNHVLQPQNVLYIPFRPHREATVDTKITFWDTYSTHTPSGIKIEVVKIRELMRNQVASVKWWHRFEVFLWPMSSMVWKLLYSNLGCTQMDKLIITYINSLYFSNFLYLSYISLFYHRFCLDMSTV